MSNRTGLCTRRWYTLSFLRVSKETTSLSMYPCLIPQPSSLSHCSAPRPGHHGQDYSVSLSQAEYLLGDGQSNGLEESQNVRGSPLHPSDLSRTEYPSILHAVENMLNDQFQSCDHSYLPLKDQSLARDLVPPSPFSTDSWECAYPAGWRGADRIMDQTRRDEHNSLQDTYGVSESGLSSSPNSSSEMTADILSSPSTESESYGQFGEQYDPADAMSLSPGQVGGTTTLGVVATQGQSAATQRASRQRQQNLQKQMKKKKDMERKRAQRFDDEKSFERICELLKIPARPKKTLVRRILASVAVLVQYDLNLDCDLQRQLETSEADLTAEHAQLFAEADTCSSHHIDANNALDGPGPGAAFLSLPWSNEELDKTYN